MKTKKIIGLGLLGVAAFALSKSNDSNVPPKGDQPPGLPDIQIDPAGGSEEVFEEKIAVGRLSIPENAKELSKEQYETFKRVEWRQLLQQKLDAGKSLSVAAQELWELWYNPNNPYRNYAISPPALFLMIITKPQRVEAVGRVLNWNSSPVYPTWTNWWNGEQAWTCSEWKVWHQKLEEHYKSTYKANQIWEPAFDHPDNNPNLNLGFATGKAACMLDCDFAEYMASKDINIHDLLSQTVCDLSNVVLNIIDTAESVSSGVKNTGKILQWGIPLAATYFAYKFITNNDDKLTTI